MWAYLIDLTKQIGYECPVMPRQAYSMSSDGDILVYGYRKGFWNTIHGKAVLRISPPKRIRFRPTMLP